MGKSPALWLQKARGLFADADRIADKEPKPDRGTNAAAERLRARMAELGQQERKDDEQDRDLDRGGPGL